MKSHTVAAGVIKSLSVSQVSKFNEDEYGGCPRKWWLTKLGGEIEPTTKAMSAGTGGHSQIEHYLPAGEDVLGKHALAGKHLLPAPGKDLFIEWGLNDLPKPAGKNYFPAEESLLTAAGIPFIGFIDLINPRGTFIDENGVFRKDPPNTVEAHDHKFTGKIKYAKTGEDLLDLTQMIGYGEFLTKKFPKTENIRLTHLYMTYDGKPEAVKATILVPVGEIHRRWENIEENVVPRMNKVAKAERVEDVPMCKNAGAEDSACNSFGRYGCSFKSICFKNPLQKMRANMGLLGNRPAAPTNGASNVISMSSVPPPPMSRKKLVVEDASTPGVKASDALQGKLYVLGGTTAAMFLCNTNGKASFLPITGGAPILLDPDTLIVLKTEEAAAAPAVEAKEEQIPLPLAPPPPVVGKKLDAQVEEIEKPKRGPGRPRKVVEEAPAAAVSGLRLYVGCVPNGAYTTLDGYVNTLVTDMREEFNVSDIRCSTDKNSPLAFGQWRGALASMVRAEPPADGSYVAFKGSELMDTVVEALAPLCASGYPVRAQ